MPTASSNVNVACSEYFTDGSVFDQNLEGTSFNINQVIPGWTEKIPYFNEGGSGIRLVSSRLADGNSGRGSIPGEAVLIFEIE
ncbi:MAG: FKBP-type peptidyl-prolyl cis-trans isomerase [Maribacter sp.]